ncbi:guanine nucleotide-binding protein subunit gamma 3-like isoform X2 [Aristolochia californica]|uniref:guanine nucleotide-binding protein subunit gamma 3-like isoform X2 n=1 Tax=Aristolochia californica TaxID=171875 RepID=UPI0035E29696
MANSTSRNAGPSPLCIPSPRSPPKYPDMCGRHRKQAELPVLNREIGFLEEELQSLDTLHPASKCCKEIDEFVGKNPDPLIPLNLKVHRSSRLWKWLCLRQLQFASTRGDDNSWIDSLIGRESRIEFQLSHFV